jgi:hypothetical protein
MRNLAFHYEAMKNAHPDERIMIVFDIDGTILDVRLMVLSVLKAYDQERGTGFFRNLSCNDITGEALDIPALLREFALSPQERADTAAWCGDNFWSKAMKSVQQPFHGVMDVIRWFQLQPNTFIGLNSGRSEHLRSETLHALNVLGKEYHVTFQDSLLFMNNGLSVAESKIQGLRRFRDQGYRIIAVIDNEKENIRAIAESDHSMDMLLFHADACFDSSSAYAFEKKNYNLFDLTELITEQQMPREIEYVWHGVDDEPTLRQFLVSSVQWAELHVRLDAKGEDLIARRMRFADLPAFPGECPARLEDFLYILSEAGKSVKLDLKDPGLTARVLSLLKSLGFRDERVWITINMEEVHRGGLKLIMKEFPGAVKQCPVDSIGPLINDTPQQAQVYLNMLSRSGIDRFSVDWKTWGCRRIIVQLQNWGFEVNIYNVPDLESFLQASLLLPKSITSYFNFPKWFYLGRSSDEEEHPYLMMPGTHSLTRDLRFSA